MDNDVSTLMAITGINDFNYAKKLLIEHNGNLEQTVHSILDGSNANHQNNNNILSTNQQPSRGTNNQYGVSSNDDEKILNNNRDIPSSSVTTTTASVSNTNTTSSISNTENSNTNEQRNTFTYLRNAPGSGILRNIGGILGQVASLVVPPPPEVLARNFVRTFKDEQIICPNFVEGSYKEAVEIARQEQKLMFIYLHCESHENVPQFVTDTLCTESLVNFLNENFISWIGDVKHSDAFRLSHSMEAVTYPFLSIVVPRANDVAVLMRQSGNIDADTLIAKLVVIMDAHHATQLQQRQRRSVHEEARILREQQDREYHEALEQDRLRREAEQLRQAEEEARLAEEKRLIEERLAEEERLKEVSAMKKEERERKRNSLPIEPPKDDERVVAMRLRLPDGSLVQRRFLNSDKMKVVFDFIESHELKIDDENINEYEVRTNFPVRVLNDPYITLKEARLGKQCTLYVREKELDDSEEDSESDSSD